MTVQMTVKLHQAGTRGNWCGYQHESWRALRQRSLWCDWSSQMAV